MPIDDETRTRWNRMFVQAEEFEAKDKVEEARARSYQILRDVERRLEAAEDGATRKQLERFLHRAERFVKRYEQLYREWNEGVKERQQRFLEREAADYHAPLRPPPLPDRTR